MEGAVEIQNRSSISEVVVLTVEDRFLFMGIAMPPAALPFLVGSIPWAMLSVLVIVVGVGVGVLHWDGMKRSTYVRV